MTPRPDPRRLTDAEKDALIRDLWAMIQERDAVIADLSKRVAELEAKLGGPPKTPDVSSVPPSQGQKANTPPGKARDGNKRRKGHGSGGRGLHRDPDQRVAARVTTCPHCAAALGGSVQTLHALYDKIELPRPGPIVTRVALYGVRCTCCGARVVAPAPAGLEPGSPFGPSIEALAIHLIIDNYGAHKTPAVKRWLKRHPPLPHPLHPHIRFPAQYGRALLRQDHSKTHPSRRLQKRRGIGDRHLPLPRASQ